MNRKTKHQELEQQKQDAKKYTRYEAIEIVHKERSSFIKETHHLVAPSEPLPFYVNEKTLVHLNFRPLTRSERRHIQRLKEANAAYHAQKLTDMLEKFQSMEIYEEAEK